MERGVPMTENAEDDWLSRIEAKYGDRRRSQFKAERAALRGYLNVLLARTRDTYSLEKVLAVGGTGVVLVGTHKRFNQPVVLKFNRPNTLPGERSMVANEV